MESWGAELFVLESYRAHSGLSWAGLSHAELTAIASVQSLTGLCRPRRDGHSF